MVLIFIGAQLIYNGVLVSVVQRGESVIRTYVCISTLLKILFPYRASLVAPTVKNSPAMQETRVQSLSWEDPLEKGVATHCNILAWRIPWTEEPGRLQSMRLRRVGQD